MDPDIIPKINNFINHLCFSESRLEMGSVCLDVHLFLKRFTLTAKIRIALINKSTGGAIMVFLASSIALIFSEVDFTRAS